MSSDDCDLITADIALIGAGPRGVIILQQLAQIVADRETGNRAPVRVLVCEAASPGSGSVWDPDQPTQLLMNGTARQTTVFPHSSDEAASRPYTSGPDLADWLVTRGRADELTSTDGYASRAAFGEYLEEMFDRAASAEPLEVRMLRGEATCLRETTDGWEIRIRLSDGGAARSLARAVILATGHTAARPDPSTQRRAAHVQELGRSGGQAIHRPAAVRPAEGFDDIPAGTPTYVEGLGLGFFDALALFTLRRGGTFDPVPGLPQGRYLASGNEPHLYAGSRRGLPFLGRSRLFSAVPVTDPELDRAFDRMSTGQGVHFSEELWPAMDRVLRGVADQALMALERSGADPALIARTLDWIALPFAQWADVRSLDGIHTGATAHERTVSFLRDQVELEALALRTGDLLDPRQLVAGALAPLRNRLRATVPGLRLSGASYRDELSRAFTPLSSFIATGPPMLRIEQTLAIAEAGALTLLGAATVTADPQGFRVRDVAGAEESVLVRALVEARVPSTGADRSDSPLLRDLFETGTARVRSVDGVPLHGVDVTVPEGRVRAADGTPHSGLFAFGIPTEGTYWNTVAGPISDAEHPIFTSARDLAGVALDSALAADHALRTAP